MPDDIQAPESRAIAEIKRAPLVVQDDVTFLFDTARFEQLQRLAGVMAACKTMPAHLKGSVSDCFRVASQAMRWQMDPFSICDKTYEVGGKLAYEGQLIAAVVNLRAGLESRLSYRYFGDPAKPETLGVCVAGKFRGEAEERTIEATWKAGFAMSKGARDKWQSQPEQQLSYFAVRVWARRHCPEIILGAYTPEEMFDDLSLPRDVTPARPALPAEPEPQRQLAEPQPKRSYVVIDADGEEREYTEAATVENALEIVFKDAKHRGRAALEAAAENNGATIAQLPTEIALRVGNLYRELYREMATDADPFGLPPLPEDSPPAQQQERSAAGGLGGPAPAGEPDQQELGQSPGAATDERLTANHPALGNRENAANVSDRPQSDLLSERGEGSARPFATTDTALSGGDGDSGDNRRRGGGGPTATTNASRSDLLAEQRRAITQSNQESGNGSRQ